MVSVLPLSSLRKYFSERNNWKVLILGFPLALTNLEKSFHNSKNSPIGGKFVKNGHIGKPLTRPCKRPPSEDPLGELGCLLLGWVNGKYIGKCGVCPGFDPRLRQIFGQTFALK